MNVQEIILLFIPMVTGFLTSYFCKIGKDAGKTIPFRPPSYIFSMVWPVLYLFMGIAWVYSIRENSLNNIPFILLNIFLGLWIVVYGCMKNKKAGVWIILLSILASLFAYAVSNMVSKLFLIPLIVWLNFALNLNMFEVVG